MKNDKIYKYLFLLIILIVNYFVINTTPIIGGDGHGYTLVMHSFRNHLSPDLQEKDINTFYSNNYTDGFGTNLNNINLTKGPYPVGYGPGKNNKLYGDHFWIYPITAIPVYELLGALRIDQVRTFQILNLILFNILLISIYYLREINKKQKIIAILLFITSPAILFLNYSGPEIFSMVFVSLALIQSYKKNYIFAILLSAIASLQNQPLVFLVLFIVSVGLIESKNKIKDLIKYGFTSTIIFIPNILNILLIGDFNGRLPADITFISLGKSLDLFFDANNGLIGFIPITLIFFFGITILQQLKNKKITFETSILILLIIIMLGSSSICNWNSGTAGPMRYVIWLMPLIFIVITKNVDEIFKIKIIKIIFILGILVQLTILFYTGPIISKINYTEHNIQARILLNHVPWIYNPNIEIFCERTNNFEKSCNKEGSCSNPTIYYYNDNCKKALVTCQGLEELKIKCEFIPKKISNNCKENNNTNWFYVNY